MTLKDIARLAGVSVSTVSRVINQTQPCPAGPEVRERIWTIVRETGYQPNESARNLKLGLSGNLPDQKSLACIFARGRQGAADPFFSQIAQALEAEAYRHRYRLKYSFSAAEISAPELFAQMREDAVDGIVILGRFHRKLLKEFSEYKKPMLYVGLNIMDPKTEQIVCSGHEAARLAVSHLHRLGHRTIGYIGETAREVRYRGYLDALSSHGLPFIQDYVISVEQSAEGGYRAAGRLQESGHPLPDALFCANDLTAIGAIRSLKEEGIRVPEDISVASIDDIDMAQYMSPMLTTVHIPLSEMGRQAARTIIDRIEGGHTLPVKTELPMYLCRRESTIPRKQKQ